MGKHQKQATMFARVNEWEQSGKSLREFASGIGITKSCFRYWVQKKRAFSDHSPAFLDLSKIMDPDVSTGTSIKLTSVDTQAQIVISFSNGMTLKIYR